MSSHTSGAYAPSPHQAVAYLVATYAELVDTGDFAGLGRLLADARFTGSGGTVTGAAAIEQMFRATLVLYPDGTPRTHHVVSNLIVDADEQAGTATSRSYVTVFQAVEGLPLQAVAAGRYHDRFARRDGAWRFTGRTVRIHLVGDTSHHLR
ncbi:nuclear transport factor 2 family protein [Streptomyces kunmingensis]|uniref:Nuclear transport factor 2 family protein n=1 Tax=Streptomyces kunmingensis TaxID=68225 RepID=A0ABU6C9Y6_9ACTN|nr:nuclear transport factor 2 family protein [Streptomyces kunmingensis]MEB3961518.1 nuclear transport factor 2 family protein [Streptomyces kunmingensis]